VTISYSAGVVTAELVQGIQRETRSMPIDLPTLLGGGAAWVGFTGATGGISSTQDIANWTFNSGIAPPAAPSQPDLVSQSDSGYDDADNITNDTMPSFTGISAPASAVTLIVDGVETGYGVTPASGIYGITSKLLADGPKLVNAVLDGFKSALSPSISITIDTVAPVKPNASVQLQTAPQYFLVEFGEPIAPNVPDDKLSLINVTTGDDLTKMLSVVVDSPAGAARWFIKTTLTDGDYAAKLAGGTVEDLAGNVYPDDIQLGFSWLTGDLNKDGQVSISDFIDLAANFGKTGATWSDGDLNLDGTVSISDFIDLAANFGKTTQKAAQAAATTEISSVNNEAAHSINARENFDLKQPRHPLDFHRPRRRLRHHHRRIK